MAPERMDEMADDPREDPEAVVKAFLQHKSLEQTQDYLARGRLFAKLWRAGRFEQLKAGTIGKVAMISARQLTRREALLLGAAGLASSCTRGVEAAQVEAAQETERHGMSAFGDLKYPVGFKHFDYVNPNALKGGIFSHVGATRAFNQNFLTFNSLNIFILKGDGAQGMELTFASLMARAADEPDSLYGLAARAVRISADGLTYRFLMRPGITFHDGSPLTAHDVAFSLKTL